MVIVYLVKKWSREVTDPGLPDASLQAGGGVIPEDWSPKPITDNLYNVIAGWWTMASTKEVAFKAFNDLPMDNMRIAVYNDWNKRKAKDYDNWTLTQAVKGEWNVVYLTWGSGEDSINQYALMVDNLERIGLE